MSKWLLNLDQTAKAKLRLTFTGFYKSLRSNIHLNNNQAVYDD